MALIVDVPLKGGVIVTGCYVRIRAVDVVRKDYNDGSYYACADLAVYKDKTVADERDSQNNARGETLTSLQVDRVKVTGVNITANIHQQLYAKLKTDLTAASITWAEE